MKKFRLILPYLNIIVGLVIVNILSRHVDWLFQLFFKAGESELLLTFFQIAIICILSFVIHYLSLGTALPSFVTAIFFGIAAQPVLAPIVQHHEALGILVGFGATLILFGVGLETPLKNFKKLFWKINSLSFIGLTLTAILFSYASYYISSLLGTPISPMVAILLGSALASTDPAAIIPVLKRLRFNNRETKDIIVAESAVTDVSGSLLTIVFLSLIVAGATFTTIGGGYQALLTLETLQTLIKEIFFGLLFGALGWLLLELLTRMKHRDHQEYSVDAAFFILVPVLSFTAAVATGGSGYLAAFIAGLMFSLTDSLHETEAFFNNTIDGFLKPMIFLLLGALVDVQSLSHYMWAGLASAAVFMLIIRPLTVYISLAPWFFIGKKMTWKEATFISFVRETGAIPAVLLVTIVSIGIGNVDGLVAIGMWVILATLMFEPPLTPLMAKLLGIGTPIGEEDTKKLHLNGPDTFVVLASRGHTHQKRLPYVVEWALNRGINKVVLLLCLEDRFDVQTVATLEREAEEQFKKINQERESAGQKPITFSIVSRSGFLQDNIGELAQTQKNIIAIFVGRRVLDYRLSEIKRLSVPLFFLE